MTVLVTAPRACQAIATYREHLAAGGCTVIEHGSRARLSEAELLPLVSGVDAIVCGDDCITEKVLAAAPRLRVIAKWGTGIDSIDVAAAAARGIEVRNTPNAFSDAVADSVMAYVLLFARQVDQADAEMRSGRWEPKLLRTLSECTLGIVGFGNIGMAVARRAEAFGMRIVVNDVATVDDRARTTPGVTVAALDDLLRVSDFVTLHADLRPTNRHLIDARRLALLRPSAVLINTARGALVDERALAAALNNGRLGGAALDVFEHEPLPRDSALRECPNVYLSPHNANSSATAAERVHAATIRHVLDSLQSKPS